METREAETAALIQTKCVHIVVQRVYGRREDAESINRGIDDHGYLQRARSVGAQRQLFDLLCHAIRTNVIAQHLYGQAANARAPAA